MAGGEIPPFRVKVAMNIKKTLSATLLLGGFVCITYPAIQMLLSASRQSGVVEKIEAEIRHYDTETVKHELEKAKEYNRNIMGSEIKDPFLPGSGIVFPDNYMDVLNVEDGIMGVLEIPSIKVRQPIYHGTSEEVLRKGVGHLKETAFPIGQKNTHAVLSTHRGLPEAKLFTDLDKLTIDDLFYIHIYNDTLAYRINQIKVVKPSETRYLKPEAEKDYVTLLTCTPYGINSHRLMVRGIRTTYKPEEKKAIRSRILPVEYLIMAGGISLFALLIWKYYRKRN